MPSICAMMIVFCSSTELAQQRCTRGRQERAGRVSEQQGQRGAAVLGKSARWASARIRRNRKKGVRLLPEESMHVAHACGAGGEEVTCLALEGDALRLKPLVERVELPLQLLV